MARLDNEIDKLERKKKELKDENTLLQSYLSDTKKEILEYEKQYRELAKFGSLECLLDLANGKSAYYLDAGLQIHDATKTVGKGYDTLPRAISWHSQWDEKKHKAHMVLNIHQYTDLSGGVLWQSPLFKTEEEAKAYQSLKAVEFLRGNEFSTGPIEQAIALVKDSHPEIIADYQKRRAESARVRLQERKELKLLELAKIEMELSDES